MDLSFVLMDRHEICTQVSYVVNAENLFSNFFPTPKSFGGEDLKFTPNYQAPASVGSARFETAQHVGKQMTDVLSAINA